MVLNKNCVYIGNPNQTRHLDNHHRIVEDPKKFAVPCNLHCQQLYTRGYAVATLVTPLRASALVPIPGDANGQCNEKSDEISGRGFLGLPQKAYLLI